jgi:hypothetical protein
MVGMVIITVAAVMFPPFSQFTIIKMAPGSMENIFKGFFLLWPNSHSVQKIFSGQFQIMYILHERKWQWWHYSSSPQL